MELNGFVGPGYQASSVNADAELLMNLFLEPIESQLGSTKAMLVKIPGTTLAELLPTGPVRGTFAQDGRMWAVGGSVLYEIFYSASGVWSATSRGTVLVDGNPVTWGSSGAQGHQLACCSGGTIYIVDLITHVFTAAVTSANQVVFYNGYFVRLDTSTSTIGLSDLYAGLTWDPTQVAQRNLASDNWVGMIVSNNQLWLFGSRSTEVWWDSGASPFPLVPFNSVVIAQGAASGFAIENFDNSIAWVGSSERGANMVWRANGYAPARISNFAVEASLQAMPNVTDWVTFAYQDQGHNNLVLTSVTANVTWVYDAALPPAIGWHRRGFENPATGLFDAYRPLFHAYCFGMHIVGDRAGRGLYQLATTNYTDVESRSLRWMRRAPHVTTEQQWMFHEQFQLDCETGVGIANGQGSDPQVMLRWSDDGGHQWSNSYPASMGSIGAYNTRTIWRRLGRSRDRVYEVSGTDPVPVRLLNAYLRLSAGTGQS